MKFINSLDMLNIDGIKDVPKADLHNHASLGISPERLIDRKLNYVQFKQVNCIEEMKTFINSSYGHLLRDKNINLSLIEGTVLSAIDDGISILECSIDYRLFEKFGGESHRVIDFLNFIKKMYSKKITVRYDLGLSRKKYQREWDKKIFDLIETKAFSGIDLYGDEKYKPYDNIKKIFLYGRKNGMKLKAHVGEFCDELEIIDVIKMLDLDVVQHGISIINSNQAMQYVKSKNIVFNVCCTSNCLLGRVDRIENHPIRKMFDFGLKVTINTDDLLIFGSSISNEYIKLYKSGVFNAEELNVIRKNGLSNI